MVEKLYVTHTCRVCGKAFNDVDEINVSNISCNYMACEACRLSNPLKDKKLKDRCIKLDNLYTYVLDNTCNEKYNTFLLDKCVEIFNQLYLKGKSINSRSILLQAIEILNYYKEDNDFEYLNNYLSNNI